MAGDHEHFHDHHDHDHSWAPWRYALLIVPVVLFILYLPKAGGKNVSRETGIGDQVTKVGESAAKGENYRIGFNQLENAARNETARENVAGSTVRLTGQYLYDRADRFTLVRYKMQCCQADAVPLKAVIMIDPKINTNGQFSVNPEKFRGKWVQITGRLEFSQIKANEWIPVILLEPNNQTDLESEVVKEVPPDTNPYAYD